MSMTDAPVTPRGPRTEHGHTVPPAATPAPPAPPPLPEHHEGELPKDLRKPHALLVIAVAVLFLALLAGLFVVGYLPHVQAEKAAQDIAEATTHVTGLVAVTHPQPAVGAKEVVLPCDIRPNQDTLIYPRASGYLKTLNVDIHDKVTKDQVLAEIDAPEVDAQLDQARAALLQAQAALQQSQADEVKAQTDLELTQRSLDRFESANATGSGVSRQELDERQTARDQARAALNQAQANVAGAKANIVGAQANNERLQVLQSFDKITAPFNGVVTVRNYDVGALLSPTGGREIFRIQQSDTLRVFVNVPQVYATQVHIGQAVTLKVRNYSQRQFQGTVARSADSLSASTRTMSYELHFANSDGALVPGMYGEVRLGIETPAEALLIPVSAMLFNAKGTQVETVVGGKVHFQNVTVGRDLGTELEVLDGLKADDLVIINPSERQVEGLAVNTAETGAKPEATRP